MNALVSQREYDLHFADAATSPGVSVFYLKLTDKALKDIEQVLRTLSSSRNPAPPPIKLQMGDNLSGTLILPQIRGDDLPQESEGSRFSISLAPQEISMDLLHTLTTYPTHEERSHIPGVRRTSMSTLPPDPDVFLQFLGPITHRLNIKATTNDTFDRTRFQFRQINEKSKNSGIRQLTSHPGERSLLWRNKFDFKTKKTYKQPFPARSHSARVPPPKRTQFSNGTLSPTRDLPPPRPRQQMSPPNPAPKERPEPRAPSPSPAPAPRKRPVSPLPTLDSPPAPSPKRTKKESPRKRHKHRSSSESILSADTLAEISRFKDQGCSWGDLYPDITSPEIRALYRQTYDRDFSSYQRLRESVEAGIQKMSDYLDQLTRLSRDSPEHKRLKRKATRLCEENGDLRSKFSYLHDKLTVVKKQIEQFDKCPELS